MIFTTLILPTRILSTFLGFPTLPNKLPMHMTYCGMEDLSIGVGHDVDSEPYLNYSNTGRC